ncbi:Fungal transcriptional regulatory protein, N-terminal [Pleurostoma richardsiae]|uniref:Fungal transcriptional regulatory protein, N-terminal n=1 Tax=Pleurostoma richardsiae TaxID=41990 RepID=A0AA38VKE0_9PEZI|nr:Fungal transcriptional regulatory protein, N-terminal [Pleurostoma richardsiae]
MGDARVEKRNRPPKSCEPCRIRKLKCNRALPCDTCTKRGKDSLCQYAPNADRTDRRNTKGGTMSERLKSLEDLISSLAAKGVSADSAMASASTPEHSTTGQTQMLKDSDAGSVTHSASTDDPPQALSGGSLNSVQASYVDSSHWSSILENIREIREQLSPSDVHEQVSAADSSTNGTDLTPGEEAHSNTDLVFGQTEALGLQDILGSLPPRHVCDSLVSHYFRAKHTIMPIVHPFKFQQEYESFWDAPANMPTIWVALLFAILGMAASLYEISGMNDRSSSGRLIPPAKSLSKRTEQCLVLGRYADADQYSVEALIIHMHSCYVRSKDSDVNLWMLMGVIIRLAIRKGYHRDPTKLPGSNLSPLEGEMRRRVWVSIFQIDALMSFQMGLPSMIPSDDCDTELPKNLEYSDFYPDITVLPPPRPLSDHTSILYTIVKARIMSMFKMVVGHTRSLAPPPYEGTIALDSELRIAYAGLPDGFKYKPLSQSIIDSAGTILNRTTIEMLHLKSIIVLHRKYITAYRHDSLYDPSRRACLEAAVTVLDRQAELYQATQAGGQLHDERWMVTALTTTDAILAAMVVCLELTIRMREANLPREQDLPMVKGDGEDFARYFAAIQTPHQIWSEASKYSTEARIAAHALGSTIERVHAYRDTQAQYSVPQGLQGLLHPLDSASQVRSPPLDHMPRATDGMEFIDWGLLDNQFQDPLGEDLDLNSWILDIVGGSNSMDLS